MISVITAHRNRFECLDLFLHSFKLANISLPYEIVIADLGSSDKVFEIIEKYKSLPIVFEHIDYTGTFWKTKALNFCAKKSNYITNFIFRYYIIKFYPFFDFFLMF